MAKVMDDEYWRQRWVNNQITFHMPKVNPTLSKYMANMTAGQEKCRILVPLCGKSEDMKWLADQGHSVVGVELSPLAVEAFYKENKLDFTSSPIEGLSDADLYKSKNERIQIYKASLFDLSRDILGEFDCIWDRGSLVALLREDMQRYVELMTSLMKTKGRCLLATFDYDQSKMNGPPFSTPAKVVEQLYAAGWDIESLEVTDVMSDKWRSRGLDTMTGLTTLLTKK
ncbi:thiopurine S-methyltransferase-like [Acanthaster planci]|uniref:thiopurine S-methyltransferase n=1 Tax=Acanthaster planci TaxID=133434 RepID=A0A8B7Y928_ACAPL|nr:thiopurine S-methyltransferase-like [Acanthaster planci]XP_022089745.1 thiopurine S-methyltransferase-like [Acanthaster planci]